MIERWSWIALGGALGSLLRYGVLVLGARWSAAGVPLAVLAVNVLGGFATGVVASLTLARGASADSLRLFAVIGLLGGFTTFSAFTWEGVELLRAGAVARAAAHALAHVLLSLAAAALGIWAARGLS